MASKPTNQIYEIWCCTAGIVLQHGTMMLNRSIKSTTKVKFILFNDIPKKLLLFIITLSIMCTDKTIKMLHSTFKTIWPWEGSRWRSMSTLSVKIPCCNSLHHLCVSMKQILVFFQIITKQWKYTVSSNNESYKLIMLLS